MRVGIRAKLFLSFGIVLMLAALISLISISQVEVLRGRSEEMYSDDLVGTGLVALSIAGFRRRRRENLDS